MRTIPAVSVIIPMYNVAKYVGECLDSLLAQTFTDFEVIIVDDCSTDNSVEVVERYRERFGGRLTLSHMKTKSKSGGGSLPRNIGVELSTGKYVYFMDADDAVTPSALDELYKIACDFDADVVHCEKFYRVPDKIWNDENLRATLKPDNYFTEGRLNVTTPSVLTGNINARINMFAQKKLIWNYWVQLVRRDYIVENAIKLQDAAAQDMIFTMCNLCSAQRYIIVPNAVYYYRVRDNSVTTERIDDATRIHKWLRVIKLGITYLDEYLSKEERLSNHPELKYKLFTTYLNQMIEGMDSVYQKIPNYDIDKFLREEFGNSDDVALKAFIFNVMNVYRLQLANDQKRFRQLVAKTVEQNNRVQQFAKQTQQKIKNFNRFAAAAKKRIAELEAEIKRLKGKE